MLKLVIFLITFQQLLFGTFLQLDQTKFDSIQNLFGEKAVLRVKYIQEQFEKIEQEEFNYTKVYKVNSLINRLLYKKDKVHWQNDHSATLLEFITSGAGDSLDFAAAKYVTLVNLGFDKSRFQFLKTDVEGISKDKFHTKNYYVLAYTPKNSKEYVVLDCYSDKLTSSVKESSDLKLSEIGLKERNWMEKDMLKINFVQHHQFLNVAMKNSTSFDKR